MPDGRPLLSGWMAVVILAIAGCGPSVERPNVPSPSHFGAADARHKEYLMSAQQGGIDLLFLGDSITEFWRYGEPGDANSSAAVWDRYYGHRRAANFGVAGDRAQHVLWRINHGELDGIQPRVVVLLVGINNLGADTPEATAEGIQAIVSTLRAKLPEAKILLMGVFPRNLRPDDTRAKVAALNARISRLDDGNHVHYLDIGARFLAPDGSISREVMPDGLHLGRAGYEIWAEAMEPKLRELLGEPAAEIP